QASRNLDAFMLPEETLRYLYARSAAAADVAVVEGVMGLYDGLRPDSIEASSAHISQLLGAPIILLVNARGMSLSLAALINGFCAFARQKSSRPLQVAGVLLNNIKSKMSFQYAKN
ncbi:MAG: AAA family ATPase, partial [Firmicutes bacterium]|nr:AAA family ATPase [Bacillota bacterium]